MFPANAKLNELLALLDYLAPVSQAAGTVTTPNWIYVGNLADQLQGEIQVGVMGAGATITMQVMQATSNAGAGAKAVTGKAITQLTQTPTNNSGTISTIDFRCQDLDTNNGFDYVQLSIVVATAACLLSAELRGSGRYEAVNAAGASLNSAAVLQQV
jgi:hypothetical protein